QRSGEQPDIIFLMLESVVDVDIFESYGVTFSENPDPFLDEAATSATVSPTRGGLTARAEFEALTGLSDAWYPEGTVEYTTFFGGNPRHIYSVVEAVQKHGYTAKAIHQNIETFFNRNIVYASMGFDDFITQEDYEVKKEDLNEDNFMKCDHLLGQLKEELEKDSPAMLWSITIETHGPYAGKYTDTKIHADSELLSGEEIAELEGYLQGVYNTDKMLSQLSAYLKERKRPTILVAFGDHWPGLNAINTLGVGADNPLITFDTVCTGLYYPGDGSDYEKLPMPERLSMNYLPTYVLHAAGIGDEPFYEYLTGLRQKEPVFQTSYLDQDRINSYEDYKMLQYDILFGEGYAGE
nr:LTA synthase family protein [Lachnospiraceae bacterium]